MAGEAQVIDRVLEEFCKQYYQSLPADTFIKDSGVLHTFSYAIIMLHTDIHKPMVVDKMTPEGFIKNVKGVNNGENLPDGFLREIYANLKSNEMKTLASRDLSVEENISHETWMNYLKTIEMYDSKSTKIYSKRDKIIPVSDIKDADTIICHFCYKNLILKIIDNIELFLANSSLDPQSIDLLIEKVLKACIHYEMSENLDNFLTSVALMAETSIDFDFMKKNDVIYWNMFCTFLVAKKTLIYLNNALPLVTKLLIGTLNFRKFGLEEKIANKYFNIHNKIKDSYKFLSKATNKSGFFDVLSSFLASKDDSSDEEMSDATIKSDKITAQRLTIYKKFYFDANIFEDMFEQTKFLTEGQINKIFETLVNDSDVLEGLKKNPTILMSLCTLCSEIALRNYDRPQIFWEFISLLLVNVSIFPNPQRQDIDSNLKHILAGQFTTKFEKFNESLKAVVERKPKKIAYI
jgi:hypothetical protein